MASTLPSSVSHPRRRMPMGIAKQRHSCTLLVNRPALRPPQQQLGRLTFGSHVLGCGRRSSRLCRSTLHTVFAKAAAAAQAHSPGRKAQQGDSFLKAPLQAWDSWWSLGREPKNEKAQRARKLGSIASKLWQIMNVNGLLLTAALFCMVRILHSDNLKLSNTCKCFIHFTDLFP